MPAIAAFTAATHIVFSAVFEGYVGIWNTPGVNAKERTQGRGSLLLDTPGLAKFSCGPLQVVAYFDGDLGSIFLPTSMVDAAYVRGTAYTY